MHHATRTLRIVLLPALSLLWCQAHAEGQSSAEAAGDHSGDVLEITIAATNGRIAWSDVIVALAESGRFDPAALDKLPNGFLNLNGRRARLAVLALDLALPPECSVEVVSGSEQVEPQLLITVDRAGMRDRTRDYKRRIRERAGTGAGEFGLKLDEDWPHAAPGRPLVVLIHGYNASPRSLSGLHSRLRSEGWVCGVFSYPDDGPIDESALLLANELTLFGREYPERDVILIAHSMGGLVARAVIEDSDLDPGNVRQLIMVGTPNHGSMLAHFPGGLDCVDQLINGRDEPGRLLARAAADGFNEAAPDMRPGSEFLRQLNARERNPQVRYSLLLGTRAPFTAAELDEFRAAFDAAAERNRLLQFVSPRLEEPLSDLDELLNGQGDGAVAVQRGRLDGVDDVQLLPVTHLTITRREDDPAFIELLDAILMRLGHDAD